MWIAAQPWEQAVVSACVASLLAVLVTVAIERFGGLVGGWMCIVVLSAVCLC